MTPLPRVVTVETVCYGWDDLPPAEYEVDHLSPWGPVVTATNPLGHMHVVPWGAVLGGKRANIGRVVAALSGRAS